VLAGVGELALARPREELGDVEGHRARGKQREGHGPEVFLEVTEQRVAQRLPVHDPAGDEGARDRALRRRPQQHADLGHSAEAVHAHGHRFDVEQRQPAPGLGQLLL
jgi:hypothetical protein